MVAGHSPRKLGFNSRTKKPLDDVGYDLETPIICGVFDQSFDLFGMRQVKQSLTGHSGQNSMKSSSFSSFLGSSHASFMVLKMLLIWMMLPGSYLLSLSSSSSVALVAMWDRQMALASCPPDLVHDLLNGFDQFLISSSS